MECVWRSPPNHVDRGSVFCCGVSAVSTLFISASNELGEFESGVVARFLGPVVAAAFGGVGAFFVTALWAWIFPALRKCQHVAWPERNVTRKITKSPIPA